jgi:anti-anti-sigma regulatory factor
MYSNSHIDIALCGRCVYVRITELASMNNCMTFQDFVTVLLDAGYERVIVDLKDCCGMDSTFMGVLAGMVTHVQNPKWPSVVVINVSKENLETMESVGLTNFLEIHSEPVLAPAFETYRIDDDTVPDIDRVEFIKEAHEKLIAIDTRNREKFGPIIEAMTQELEIKNSRRRT